ncbi:MAG: acetyl-CoA C-acetyltransferase, partial [Gammaproteobacteria bacterium]|nr:acetyl-CoA C-acetyltransferase [Gammaproteobacteria bacterium]
MSTESIVIISARRTPIGAFQGALAPASAPELGAAAIRACLDDAAIDGGDVDEALLGCVLPA